MRSNERGITIVELIIATGLFFGVITLVWSFMDGALTDSANINNQMVVQTSVNQLMNNIQKHVQEASMPISDVPGDISCISEKLAGTGAGVEGEIMLKKPGGVSVTYSYKKQGNT